MSTPAPVGGAKVFMFDPAAETMPREALAQSADRAG